MSGENDTSMLSQNFAEGSARSSVELAHAKSSDHIREVDTLRAVATIFTILAHLAFMTTPPDVSYVKFVNTSGQFWSGVELFFVVSGFVVSRQLWPQIDAAATTKNLAGVLKSFFIRRAFRILPLAILWATIVLAASHFHNASGAFGPPKSTSSHFIAAMLFVENVYLTFEPGEVKARNTHPNGPKLPEELFLADFAANRTASSAARTTALALLMHSCCSFSGIESCTTPAPA